MSMADTQYCHIQNKEKKMLINRKTREALEKLKNRVTGNATKFTVIQGDETIEGSIKSSKHSIIGSANKDFDTLGEIQDYVLGLESNLRQVIEDYRTYSDEIFALKSDVGGVDEDAVRNFINTMGLVTKNSLIDTLNNLKSNILKHEFIVGQEPVQFPKEVNARSILSVKLPYPDGRSEEIIHYTLEYDEETETHIFSGYNHFLNDLIGRTLIVNYIVLTNIIK